MWEFWYHIWRAHRVILWICSLTIAKQFNFACTVYCQCSVRVSIKCNNVIHVSNCLITFQSTRLSVHFGWNLGSIVLLLRRLARYCCCYCCCFYRPFIYFDHSFSHFSRPLFRPICCWSLFVAGRKIFACNWTDHLILTLSLSPSPFLWWCAYLICQIRLFIHSVNEGFTCGIFAVSVVTIVLAALISHSLSSSSSSSSSAPGLHACVRACLCVYGPFRTPNFCNARDGWSSIAKRDENVILPL